MSTTRTLYQIEGLPIFQNRIYDSELSAKHSPLGDIKLVEDLETGLVYNDMFRPELMDYNEQYNNEQASSPAFRQHLDMVAEIIERNMGRAGIVEIGCGKGYFLEMLLTKGFDATGFDPTYAGTNYRIAKCYFHPNLGIRGDGLVLRHVLEHIQDPVGFLSQLRDANGGSGKIYIEVPCFDWICEHKTWIDVFYEHVNYFRLSDFQRMFGVMYESGRSFGGQYLSIVAELSSLRRPVRDPHDGVRFPHDFGRSLIPCTGERCAVWSAGSKGVIFALMMERSGARPDFVVDINPAKQGKYLPSTGLKISSPAEALGRLDRGSTIYVMNSNYMAEIKEMSLNRYKYVAVDE
jgi:SAM-dependent methyltransferase